MKTLHTDFKLWVGDNVYYIFKGDIISTYVYSIEYHANYCTKESMNSMSIVYITQNGCSITDKDINTIYFTDKKELIQHLVAQL